MVKNQAYNNKIVIYKKAQQNESSIIQNWTTFYCN